MLPRFNRSPLKKNSQQFNNLENSLQQFYLKWVNSKKKSIQHQLIQPSFFIEAFDQTLYSDQERYKNNLPHNQVFDFLRLQSIQTLTEYTWNFLAKILTNCLDSSLFQRYISFDVLKNFVVFIELLWKKMQSQIVSKILSRSFKLLVLSLGLKCPEKLNIKVVLMIIGNLQQFNLPLQKFSNFLSRSIFSQKNYRLLNIDEMNQLLKYYSQLINKSIKNGHDHDHIMIGRVLHAMLSNFVVKQEQLKQIEHPLDFSLALNPDLNRTIVQWRCCKKQLDSSFYKQWTTFISERINQDNIELLGQILVDNTILLCRKKCSRQIISGQIFQLIRSNQLFCEYLFQRVYEMTGNSLTDAFLDNVQTYKVLLTLFKEIISLNKNNLLQILFLKDENWFIQNLELVLNDQEAYKETILFIEGLKEAYEQNQIFVHKIEELSAKATKHSTLRLC